MRKNYSRTHYIDMATIIEMVQYCDVCMKNYQLNKVGKTGAYIIFLLLLDSKLTFYS